MNETRTTWTRKSERFKIQRTSMIDDIFEDIDILNNDIYDDTYVEQDILEPSTSKKKLAIKIGGPSAQASPSAASTNMKSRAESAAKFDAIVRNHLANDDIDSLLMFEDELESFTSFRESFSSDEDFVVEAYNEENMSDDDIANALSALQENDIESAFLILKQKLGESMKDSEEGSSDNDSPIEDDDDMSWMDDVFAHPELIHKRTDVIDDAYDGLEFAEYSDEESSPTENLIELDMQDIIDSAIDYDNSDGNDQLLSGLDELIEEQEQYESVSPIMDYDAEVQLASMARQKQAEKESAYKKADIPEELYAMSSIDLSAFPELDEQNQEILKSLASSFDKERLSEIAYAYKTGRDELPSFVPPMKAESLQFKSLDESKEVLGVCICSEVSYGIYTTSQQEISDDDLFAEQTDMQWSPDALKAVPIKALYGSYDDQIEKVIAVSPTFLSPEEIVEIKRLIMDGATLLINALPGYDFGEEPMYASYSEMNSAICQADNFKYQAKVYALEKMMKDNGINVPLVGEAILSLIGNEFSARTHKMLSDMENTEESEKRDILLGNSNEIRLALPSYANDASDDDFAMAKGLLEVASKMLENDHLSHSNYYSDRYVNMVTELLSLNKFQSYYDSIKNKIPTDILFNEF